MTHSGFEPDPGSSEAAIGYGSFSGFDPQPVPREPAGWMFSAGSLYSTPSDVVTWDLDRSLLSEDFDAFLTPEKVERAARSLRELGEPKSIKLLSTNERGDMADSVLEFEFEKTGLLAELCRSRDGKVQEFFLCAK
jgi:hypothetical protein